MSDWPGRNVPGAAIIGAVVTLVGIAAGVVVALARNHSLDEKSTPLVVTIIGLVASTIPSLLAMLYAGRASSDLRNGTVVEKVKQGTAEVLQETGVVTRTGPTATATTAALAAQTEALAEILRAVRKE